MASPLGAANYILLLYGTANLERLETTGLDCREVLEISQQRCFPNWKILHKNAFYIWSTVSAMNQVKSKNKSNCTESLNNSLRLATANILGLIWG